MGQSVNGHFSQNFDTFDIFLIKITDINANTSILVCLKARVTFRVMYLGRCVIVDDSGNYVTYQAECSLAYLR